MKRKLLFTVLVTTLLAISGTWFAHSSYGASGQRVKSFWFDSARSVLYFVSGDTQYKVKTEIKYQYKFLQADQTTENVMLADVNFEDLVIGNTYKISFLFYGLFNTTGEMTPRAGNTIGGDIVGPSIRMDNDNVGRVTSKHSSFIWVATDTDLGFWYNGTGGSTCRGDGTIDETHSYIEDVTDQYIPATEH